MGITRSFEPAIASASVSATARAASAASPARSRMAFGRTGMRSSDRRVTESRFRIVS